MIRSMQTRLRNRVPALHQLQILAEFVSLSHLRRSVIELNSIEELKKIFNWKADPLLDDSTIHQFEYPEDANQRRLRDAESLGTVIQNSAPKICVDIGTSTGHSAALMAVNAPQAHIYTINIPPEEILSGEGGTFTTIALERENIGSYYRQRGLVNITQILSNTAKWQPNIGQIDVAFIDGSHDTDFVFNDSRKALQHMLPGGFLLWHDFNLELTSQYDWIYSVCLGVEKLYRQRLLKGRIYHVRDSWVAIYQVPK